MAHQSAQSETRRDPDEKTGQEFVPRTVNGDRFASLQHRLQKEAGQRRQRCDVNADHALLLCQIGFGKRAVVAKPGVIDQAIHVYAKRADPIKHPLRRSWLAEVLGYSVHGDASPQFVSGGLKRALVATDQNQVVLIGRSLPCQFEPYAAIGTSNKREDRRLVTHLRNSSPASG